MPFLVGVKALLSGCLLCAISPTSSRGAEEKITPAEVRDAAFLNGSVALVKGEYREALRWFRIGAEHGDPRAEASLGYMYFNGFEVEKDLSEAKRLYEQSAAGGCHQGLNNLAHLFRFGLAGLPEDKAKARILLERAAKAGNEKAVQTLARGYLEGEWDGKPGPELAIHWLEFGAGKGFPGSLSDLGFAYQKGIGVPQDLGKAVALYRSSVAAGSSEGASNLGYLYFTGQGVEKNPGAAAALYELAIKGGSQAGKINLAVLKRDFPNVSPDDPSGLELLRQAANEGSKEAAAMLEKWERHEPNTQSK